jgi:hypothetical protein
MTDRQQPRAEWTFGRAAKWNEARNVSGRSSDLRFVERWLPSQEVVPSGFHRACQVLCAYSYGVATDLHRLPEHQTT